MSKKTQIVDLPPWHARRIDPQRPAADQIAAQLQKAILETSLTPGQILSETEVGHLYGASRTPVREAFSKLRDSGLIVTLPSRGSFVAKLSLADIKGAQYVREALEVRVADTLCETGLTDPLVDVLREILATQRAHVASGDTAGFHDADDAFHQALSDAIGHPRLTDMIAREKMILDRLRVLSLQSTDQAAVLAQDHQRIFDAIRARNRAQARQEVRQHLRRVLATLTELADRHGEYFDP